MEGVSCGTIVSSYQRFRVENVCERLGLVPLTYLWQRDRAELLREMIDAGVNAVLVKVAGAGLDPDKHLGIYGIKMCYLYPILTSLVRQVASRVGANFAPPTQQVRTRCVWRGGRVRVLGAGLLLLPEGARDHRKRSCVRR